MNRKKRADFNWTGEFLGVIIAVAVVVLLVFLGIKLHNLFVEQDMKNAKAFIEGLNGKIENLNDGESNNFVLRGIPDWVLVGYNVENPSIPDKCFVNSCICLCESKDNSIKCQDMGYCRNIDRNVIVWSSAQGYFFDGGRDLSAECIVTDNQLSSLRISKTSDIISINQDYGSMNSVMLNSIFDSGCPRAVIGN